MEINDFKRPFKVGDRVRYKGTYINETDEPGTIVTIVSPRISRVKWDGTAVILRYCNTALIHCWEETP